MKSRVRRLEDHQHHNERGEDDVRRIAFKHRARIQVGTEPVGHHALSCRVLQCQTPTTVSGEG